jgi:hypothetical protein
MEFPTEPEGRRFPSCVFITGKANTGEPKVSEQLLAWFGGGKEHPIKDGRWAYFFNDSRFFSSDAQASLMG